MADSNEILKDIPKELTDDNVVNYLKPFNKGAKTDQDIRTAMLGTDNLTKSTVIAIASTFAIKEEIKIEETKSIMKDVFIELVKRFSRIEEDEGVSAANEVIKEDPKVIAARMEKYLEEHNIFAAKADDATFDVSKLTPTQQQHYKIARVFSDPKNVAAYQEYQGRVVQMVGFGLNACANAIFGGAPVSAAVEIAGRKEIQAVDNSIRNMPSYPELVNKAENLGVQAPPEHMAVFQPLGAEMKAKVGIAKVYEAAQKEQHKGDEEAIGKIESIRGAGKILADNGVNALFDNWASANKSVLGAVMKYEDGKSVDIREVLAKHHNEMSGIPAYASAQIDEKVKVMEQAPSVKGAEKSG